MTLLNFIKKLIGIKPKKTTNRINFGWKRDLPDQRDKKFKIVAPHDLPAVVDLRAQCPPVYNQGNLGSCTANALGGAFQFEQMKQNKPNFIPSRLFIYYNERAMEGTINEDAGAMIRDGIKTMNKEGVCPETMWQYIESKFTSKPCPQCYKTALDNQVLEYLRLSPHTIYEVKHCLSDGYPVAFGFTIYESFMTEEVTRTGIAKMPQTNESPIGGHAVLAVGYDDSKEALIVRNSWGAEWGLGGYFYLPYGYVTQPNLSADYWTIRLVE
jgi:C1A family cysteine protease